MKNINSNKLDHGPGNAFGRPRLLIVGCGDVGMRLLPLVRAHFRVFAVTSKPERCAELRAAGAVPLVADLDRPASLKRLAGLAQHVVHLAPPQAEGREDRRTRNLTAILPEGGHVFMSARRASTAIAAVR